MKGRLTNDPPDSSKRRIGLRFGLRTGLILLTAFCVGLGLHVQRSRNQRRAVEAVLRIPSETGPPSVYYDYELNEDGIRLPNPVSPVPAWLLQTLGRDFFHTVVDVNLDGDNAQEEDLKALSDLPYLQYLDLEYNSVTESGLQVVGQLKRLRRLDLQETGISDEGLQYLAGLHDLRVLSLSDHGISDEGLSHLGDLPELQRLTLRVCDIDGSGLIHLTHLRKLEELDLRRTEVTDEALRYLIEFKNLKEVLLPRQTTSAEAVDRLQRAMPNCTIQRKD